MEIPATCATALKALEYAPGVAMLTRAAQLVRMLNEAGPDPTCDHPTQGLTCAGTLACFGGCCCEALRQCFYLDSPSQLLLLGGLHSTV